MPGESDRNRPTDMERLLGQTMRAGLAESRPPTPECLDAERLAAWSDGALSAIEGFDVEQHLSTCERCQAMLAAYVRLTGAEPEAATVLPFWRRPAVRWMAPVAAAVAASVVWFVMPRPTSLPAPTTQMARAEERADRGVAPPPATTSPAPLSATPRAAERSSNGAANMQDRGPSRERQGRAAASKSVTGTTAASGRERSGELSPSPPAAVPANPAMAAAEPSREVTITAEVTPVQTASRPTTTPPATALMARVPTGVIEIVPRSLAASLPAGGQADAAAAVGTPAIRTHWQIRPNGTAVRILGDASRPEAVVLSRPARVTAGDAASPSECWLIGSAGAVWRSTDGLHFDRVTTPIEADLRAIVATGSRQATVTTVDGRQFATTDAGATWQILQSR